MKQASPASDASDKSAENLALALELAWLLATSCKTLPDKRRKPLP